MKGKIPKGRRPNDKLLKAQQQKVKLERHGPTSTAPVVGNRGESLPSVIPTTGTYHIIDRKGGDGLDLGFHLFSCCFSFFCQIKV